MTRYKTYQMEYGWITIDTKTENPPENPLAGPFDVTLPEVDEIKNAAIIELNETEDGVNIIPDKEA